MANLNDVELTKKVILTIKVQGDKKHCSRSCPFYDSETGYEGQKICYQDYCRLFKHRAVTQPYAPGLGDNKPSGTRLQECIEAFGE